MFFEDVDLAAGVYDLAVMDAILKHVVYSVETLQYIHQFRVSSGVVAIQVSKL